MLLEELESLVLVLSESWFANSVKSASTRLVLRLWKPLSIVDVVSESQPASAKLVPPLTRTSKHPHVRPARLLKRP